MSRTRIPGCRERPPAAADVEDAHSRLQGRLATDEVQLRLLRLVQIAGAGPVPAAVRHAPVEHRLVEIIAEVVVALADLERSRRAPPVRKPREGDSREIAPDPDVLWHARREETAEERLELLAIPPAVDIALPETERAFREDAAVEAFVVDLGVPRRVSTEPETRGREEFLENASASGHS